MIWKTHLAIGLAIALYFSDYVNKRLIFIHVVLISSFFPDIDSRFSYMGKRALFRPVQWTASHRGIIHSYTMCIALSLLIAFFFILFGVLFLLFIFVIASGRLDFSDLGQASSSLKSYFLTIKGFAVKVFETTGNVIGRLDSGNSTG